MNIKKHLLINLCPTTDGRIIVLDYYKNCKQECLVVSINKILDIKSIYDPNDALLLLHSNNISTVILYDIYPFDTTYGYIIEIMLTLYSKKCIFIYVLYFYDFTNISTWLSNCEIINNANEFYINVKGFLPSKNDFLFESKLNYKLLLFINGQTIIRTPTKKCCILGVKFLIDNVPIKEQTCHINNFNDLLLKESVQKGIGYLCYDMDTEDKDKVIDLYNEGFITCIITTTAKISLRCDTYIVKTTKKYTKNGYKEFLLQEIVECCKFIQKKGTLCILTEKEMHKNYVKLLSRKNIPSYFDYMNSSKDQLSCKYSILEYHLPELFLHVLFLQDKYSIKTFDTLKNTFFVHNLIKKSKNFDFNELDNSVLKDLFINKFVDKSYNLNKNFTVLFLSSNLLYDQYNVFAQNNYSVEKLANYIAEITNLQKNKKQTFYDSYMLNKIDKSTKAYQKYMYNLELSVKIKKEIGKNLSVTVILLCQLLSEKPTKKIKEINIENDSFHNNEAKVIFRNNKITIEVNCIYFLIIENNNNVVLETQVDKLFTCSITENDCEIYLLNVYNFSKSIILQKTNKKIGINEKYYCVFGKYVVGNKITKKNTKIVNEHTVTKRYECVNGIQIELYNP